MTECMTEAPIMNVGICDVESACTRSSRFEIFTTEFLECEEA